MKVIDLLINISKDKDIPNSIKINDATFTYDTEVKMYFCDDPLDKNCPLDDTFYICPEELNKEVEIIGQ